MSSLPYGNRRAEVAIATVLGLALAALMVITPGGPRQPALLVLGILLAAAQSATILVLRRHPEAGMAAAVATGVGLELLSPNLGWLGQVSAILAVYARCRTPRRSLWVLGLLIAATPWKLVTGDWRNLLLAVAGPLIGWMLGELGRTRALRRQAERRGIVAGERARIARELHDVLAHTVSVIAVQAQAAEDVFDRRPEQARKALGTIGTAATSTLRELRMLLHTLAEEDGETGPQPGLDRLEALAASMGATGLRVRLETTPVRLPPAVDLSAYRIVQESLTNTLRHSQATQARVTVSGSTPGSVRLEICDDGPPRSTGRVTGSGRRGLIGMRERARLLGGTLAAGPTPEGGFRVCAELPVDPAGQQAAVPAGGAVA
ncbi:sensor histidine kinase [Actinoplanes sp. N902-109]|uniref:sensor histidine kinase n=1 Tax=Actinoplanes sp. (strain N902-109) TaxID=649831 RepID=UPI0003293BEA|nr:sensor histidine kinase [Actinoplanes sp. N902-109]AGL17389.1 integral membrane sensor signal transduction histidine kinase [Actinoplanes sp. N902-109]